MSFVTVFAAPKQKALIFHHLVGVNQLALRIKSFLHDLEV